MSSTPIIRVNTLVQFETRCRMKDYFRRIRSPQHILISVHTHFAQINRIACKLTKNGTQLNFSTRRTKIVSNSEPPLGWRAPRFWIPFKILHNNSELHVLLTCVCQSPYFPTFFVICRQASRKTAQFISNVTFKSWARARKRNFSNWKLIVLAIWVSCCAWSPPKWPQSRQQTGTLMSLLDPSIHYCGYIELVCFP